MSARDELQDLREMLGEAAFIDACWAMRINASTPPPKAFQRGWAWKRPKVVSLQAYRRQNETDLEQAGNGIGLR